jgi:hypothetical protein
MKKVKIFGAVMAVAAIAACISGVDAAGVLEFLFGGAGVGMAFAAMVGTPTDTVTAGDLDEAGLVDQDLSKVITQFNPDRFPLDTITREYLKKKRKAKSQKVSYFEKSSKPLSDTLDASGASVNAANTESNAAKANTATNLTEIWIKVATPSTWRTKDTLRMLKDQIGENDEQDVQFYVAEKKGAALRIVPTNGKMSGNKYIVPTFTASTVLYRQGNAMAEKDMTVEAFAVVPEERVQYCQNYMAQAEESFFASLTAKKAEWDFDDMELEVIYSLRGEIEMSSFFGAKHEIKDGSNVTLFTDGLVRNITKELTYGDTEDGHLSKEEYTAWMRSLFTGNSGSKERVLFAGSELVAEISLLRETYKTMSNNVSEDTSLGVRCTSIVSDFGTLKIVHHPLFDEAGWSKNGVAIDLEHLTKFEFVPMKATELDLRGSGQSNVNAKVIQEVSCMVLKYPECHAIIKPAV